MYFWLTAIIAFFLDRYTKHLVSSRISLGETYPIIQDFFHITYIKNPGAAFGLLADMRWLFIILTLVIMGVLVYLVYTTAHNRPFLLFTLGIVAGGALGNLMDRIQGGLVIDFLDFRGIWPYIFNVADSFIVVGVGLLAVQLLLEEKF